MPTRHSTSAVVFLSLSAATAVAQGNSTISARGIDGIVLCQPLSTIPRKFPLARDTIIESEGSQWPAKVLRLSDGGEVLFESSWVDTTHVWVISTTSPMHRTAHGYRVGMSLGDLRAKGEQLRFNYAEGYIVITLIADQVEFSPDDGTAAAFLNRSPTAYDSLDALPSTARIKELHVSRDCRR